MKQTSEEFRGKLGLAITWIGILGLPLGVGVVLGYYAGDRGVLWLPTMLHILLVITIGSVLAIIGGGPKLPLPHKPPLNVILSEAKDLFTPKRSLLKRFFASLRMTCWVSFPRRRDLYALA